MENFVFRTRERAYPGWKQLIFSEPFRWVGPTDERSFTRFQFIFVFLRHGWRRQLAMIITLTYSSSLNISHLLDEKGRLMQNDNPLEWFNRKLNDRIPQHPMVQVFVQIVRDMHLLWICWSLILCKSSEIKTKLAGKRPKHAPEPCPYSTPNSKWLCCLICCRDPY